MVGGLDVVGSVFVFGFVLVSSCLIDCLSLSISILSLGGCCVYRAREVSGRVDAERRAG